MNETKRFEGKVAFITGAGGGLGRGVAIGFAKEGANVVVTDLSEKANRETARMVEEAGGRALAVTVDVTKSDDIKNALAKTVETFGKLDFAFNNAGIEYKIQPLHEIEEEEFERLNSIDLLGVFKSMKYEIPLMLENGGGAIVNTSSTSGVAGFRGCLCTVIHTFACFFPGRLHVCVRQVRRGGTYQVGRFGLCWAGYPHQCRVSGCNRHGNDTPFLRRHSRRLQGDDSARAYRTPR